MNFGFTEEQELLRSQVRKFLDDRCPLSEVRALMATPEGFSAELWQEMAALGWLGLTVPEAHGGVGLTWVDLTVVLEETGRTLFPSPLIATTLATAAIIRCAIDTQQDRFLPSLADGSRIGTLAFLEDTDTLGPEGVQLRGVPDGGAVRLTGTKRFVMDAGAATLFIVAFRASDRADDVTLAAIERETPGLHAETFPTMDQTKRLGNLQLSDVRVRSDDILCQGPTAAAQLRMLESLGAVAVTAEIVGAAEAAHRLTTEYAKTRVQFGKSIGRYQAVKHPLAETYVDIESFRSLLYYAAWAADEDLEALPRSASYAKAYASEAFARLGIDGVQLHGAVGYTEEVDIQLYLKRAKWARTAFGDADYHYDRVAALGGL